MPWQRLLSRTRLGRAHPDPDNEARTDFQRDFDRIVFSSALRRLQDKTQVFPLARSDYVRTRLTHSLEVSSVGRSLGTMVGDALIQRHRLQHVYPQDFGALVAAAGLAHDIGNPPFGHAGEDAMRLWFARSATAQQALQALTPAQQQDFLHFEGNAQGFRILTRLQNPDNRGGMQLTSATLGAFSKYPRGALAQLPEPCPAFLQKFGFYQDDAPSFTELAAQLGLKALSAGVWTRHPLAYLVEAADDICYRIIDIEDAFRLQQVSFNDVCSLLLPLTTNAHSARNKLRRLRRPKEQTAYLRARAIGDMINQVYACFMDYEAQILDGTLQAQLLDLIPAAAALRELRTCGERQIYVAPPVIEIEVAGFEVLGALLETLVTAVQEVATAGARATSKSRMLLHLVPEAFIGVERQPNIDPYRRLLGITDFISGMTDSYAVALFKKITGIALP